jgi:hypothetical protein
MWEWALFGLFAFGLAAAVFCIYRLHLISGPKPKKDKNQPKKQSWAQQKQQIGAEIDRFLDSSGLPCFLLEPGIYHQQLQLLKFPNRNSDSRYESNQDMILNPFQPSLKSFLVALKKKGYYLQGYEEEFLAELVRRISNRNYQSHLHDQGNLLAAPQDFQSAAAHIVDPLVRASDGTVEPELVTLLISFYREPIIFRSAYNQHNFNNAVGLLDFWRRYFKKKGVADTPVTLKEFVIKLEEAFSPQGCEF